MCDSCSANHGTTSISRSWRIAHSLIESLTKSIEEVSKDEHKRTHQENIPSPNLPSLKSMKILSLDDKKTLTQKDPKKDLKIANETVQQLIYFDMQTPTFARGLSHSVEQIQSETIPSLMRSALETFPCRCCLDKLTTGSLVDTPAKSPEVPIHGPLEAINPQDIFGKRLGIWKVLLSNVAFKNIQRLAGLGTFNDYFAFNGLAYCLWSLSNYIRSIRIH
jgi:hypothetical protein